MPFTDYKRFIYHCNGFVDNDNSWLTMIYCFLCSNCKRVFCIFIFSSNRHPLHVFSSACFSEGVYLRKPCYETLWGHKTLLRLHLTPENVCLFAFCALRWKICLMKNRIKIPFSFSKHVCINRSSDLKSHEFF